MPWKRGRIKLDDGSSYPAEMLVKDNGEVWNVKIQKGSESVLEIDANRFASMLDKSVEEVYPFTYEVEE